MNVTQKLIRAAVGRIVNDPLRVLVFTVCLLVAKSVVAQTDTRVSIHGVAFDSVHNGPLVAATVTISGTTRTTTTDPRGRFAFDSVEKGVVTLIAFHPSLDTIGIGAIFARATLTSIDEDVRIAVPSFATLWRPVCGPSRAPRDSGFVYGSIKDAAAGKPVVGAAITVMWPDATTDSAGRNWSRVFRKQTRSDAAGTYAICDVPISAALRIQAVDGDRTSDDIDLLGSGIRVQRRDLSIGSAGSDLVHRGTVVGTLTASGAALSGARAMIEGVREVRTGSGGQFVLRNVPAGTRQLSIKAVGFTPRSVGVDVVPGDTATVTVELSRVTTLGPVRVTAAQQRLIRELEERRRQGFGYMVDSSDLEKMGTLMAGLQAAPNVRVTSIRNSAMRFLITLPTPIGRCVANLWVDGLRLGDDTLAYDILTDMTPAQVAAVEFYPRPLSVPPAFVTPRSNCGTVLVWTKWTLGR